MTITGIRVTFYMHTGYSPANEPASDSVINLNSSAVMPVEIRASDPWKLTQLKVTVSEEDIQGVDYIKVSSPEGRWYYYVLGYEAKNEITTILNISLDHFATVGLGNISFFGNIVRRSLSPSEASNYPLLPEPWAPRRPLKTRRILLNLNTNKSERLPSRITTVFEDESTAINQTQTINVPNNLLIPDSTTPDSLSVSATLSMQHPNAASASSHTITTPWGNISYTTPYEQYLQLSGAALSTFLANAKKSNALDLMGNPYYLPNPAGTQTVQLPELQNPNTKNIKASKHYTTITIRSLAANTARTFSDDDTVLSATQSIAVVIVPDKDGGIYVIPTTLRDTGLTAYTYLEGVYSPFETVMYNAVGDTPAKFASDGTIAMNTALANLFQTYANKINANQYENMQANYFKDLTNSFGVAAGLITSVLETTSRTTGSSSSAAGGTLVNISQTTTNNAARQSIGTTVGQVKSEMGDMLVTPDNQYMGYEGLTNAIFGSHKNEVHNFMLGNINDYLNRWASVQNDIHNGKVANLFKNITIVGTYGDVNKLAGQYEILVASLRPEDERNFDMFLDHFGHAVDEYSDSLVPDVNTNYNYVMVGDDAIMTNTVRADANTPILTQFKTGVRVWKTLIRAENF